MPKAVKIGIIWNAKILSALFNAGHQIGAKESRLKLHEISANFPGFRKKCFRKSNAKGLLILVSILRFSLLLQHF